MADIRYTVTIDAATGAAEIKKLEGEFDKLSKTTKGTGEATKELESKSGGLWKQFALGQIVVSAGQKALNLFWGELKSTVSAAADSEKAQKGLDSALFSTGRTASYLPEHFRKYAAELQRVTKYSDEETMRAQAMILQLSNLDKEGLDKATKGAMGLATVFDMKLGPASEMVGKWMAGSTERLVKYGIHINDTMTAEQKRNVIIDRLLEYYPRVIAETGTYSGKLDILKSAYDEVKEAAGRYITENTGVLKALNWLSNALFDLADAQGAVERAKKSHAEIDKYWSESFYKAANATKMNSGELVKLIAKFTELGPVVRDSGIKPLIDLDGTWQEQERAVRTNWVALVNYIREGKAGAEMLKAFRTAVIASIKPLKDLKGETGKGTLVDPEAERKALEALKKILEEAKKAREDARARLQKGQDDWYKEQLEKEKKNQEDIKKVHADARQRLQEGQDKYFKDLIEKAKQAKEKMISIIDDIRGKFSDLFSAIGDLSKASGDRQIDNLDKVYEKQKQQVIDSLLSEQEKADQLKVLDEKQGIARKNLMRQVAKDQKAASVFQAIIDMAAAFIKTLAIYGGTPWGFISAAVVIAAGAIKLAAIRAQPIPLAKGFEGVVRQPTTFMAGEAGPEYLSVRPGEQGGGQAIRISLAIPIYLAGYKFDEKFIEIAGRLSTAGRLKIAAKAIQ